MVAPLFVVRSKVAMAKLPTDMEVDPEIRALYLAAADRLRDEGYTVEKSEVPDLAGTWRLWADLGVTEMALLQEESMRSSAPTTSVVRSTASRP